MKSYLQIRKAKEKEARFNRIISVVTVLAVITLWYFIVAGILDQI